MNAATAAVKYCGGCNPYYDAFEAVSKIEKATGLSFSVYDPENPPDICLVVKQCRAECIKADAFLSGHNTVLIQSAGEIHNAAAEIIKTLRNIGRNPHADEQTAIH